MIQISKHNTSPDLNESELAIFKKQWKDNGAILLPKLFDADLLGCVRSAIERGKFTKIKHAGVDATELTLDTDFTIDLLEMMASEPAFTDTISKITGLKPIGHFHGRVYNISNSDHDDWHQDAGFDYLMAMSVNLSPKPYQGGSLRLREVESKKVLSDIRNTGEGDALIFNISKSLEHKITPVHGDNPKIAFAGWFRPKPLYQDYMNKTIHKVIKKSKVLVKKKISSAKSSGPFRISQSVAFRMVGNKALLVDLGDDSQCVLNGMGAKIWKSLCEGDTQDQTIADLKSAYGLEVSDLDAEYRNFVEELFQIGYLEV